MLWQGRRSIFLSRGAGNELQVYMEICNNGGRREVVVVRSGAPEKILQSMPYNSMGNALLEYSHASCLGRKRQIKSLKCW